MGAVPYALVGCREPGDGSDLSSVVTIGGTGHTRNDDVKYMLLIYGNADIWESMSEKDFAGLIAGDAAFRQEIQDSGEFVSVHGLTDATNAKVVRVRDGAPVVTDGPYLESREYLASLFVIDCESMERALELAARYPTAQTQGVEVWPLMSESGMEM